MRIASMIANISLAYVDQDFLVTPNARLMYATGFPCWVRTAPISSLNASILIVKALLKLSMANEGVVFMACLRARKAASASSCHLNWLFFRRLVSEETIMP